MGPTAAFRFVFSLAVVLALAAAFRPFSNTNFFGLGKKELRQCKLDASGSLIESSAAIRAGANVQAVKTIDDFESVEKNSGGKLVRTSLAFAFSEFYLLFQCTYQ
jgi:hypothetical protein